MHGILLKCLRQLESTKKVSKLVVANAVYSLSTFIITLLLPYIAFDIFGQAIYVLQMSMFATSLLQNAMTVTLYYFYKQDKEGALAIYYFLILLMLALLVVSVFFFDNRIVSLLSLSDLSHKEYIAFILSVAFPFSYACSRGVDIASSSYNRMLYIALSSLLLRIVGLIIIFLRTETTLNEFLLLLCVLPFLWDMISIVKNIVFLCRIKNIRKGLLISFLTYMGKLGVIGWAFSFSDRLFLIKIKGIDAEFASAVAFSLGFVSTIALFTSSLSNYFISTLRSDDIHSIQGYLNKLKKVFPIYVATLLFISLLCSWSVHVLYPQLGILYSWVTLATLLKVGIITYLGLHSLLVKVFNYLNLELTLNLLRVVVVYILCNLWTPSDLLLWYCVVLVAIPLPELTMTIIVRYKVKKTCVCYENCRDNTPAG